MVLGILGEVLGDLGANLERSWRDLRPSWPELGRLEAVLNGLGAVLGRSWLVLGGLGALLRRSGPIWGGSGRAKCGVFHGETCIFERTTFSAKIGVQELPRAILGLLRAILGRLGAILEPSKGDLGAILGVLERSWFPLTLLPALE